MVGAEEKRCCSTDHHHHHHRQQDNIDLLLLLLLLASIPRRWSIREISFSLTQWLRRLFLNKSSGGLDMIIIIEDLRYFTRFYWFSILLGIKFQAIYMSGLFKSLYLSDRVVTEIQRIEFNNEWLYLGLIIWWERHKRRMSRRGGKKDCWFTHSQSLIELPWSLAVIIAIYFNSTGDPCNCISYHSWEHLTYNIV